MPNENEVTPQITQKDMEDTPKMNQGSKIRFESIGSPSRHPSQAELDQRETLDSDEEIEESEESEVEESVAETAMTATEINEESEEEVGPYEPDYVADDYATGRRVYRKDQDKRKRYRFHFHKGHKHGKHAHGKHHHGKKGSDNEDDEQEGGKNAHDEEDELKHMSVDEALEKYNTSMEGLSNGEATARIETYGRNALEEEKRNPVLKFLSLMWNPLSWAMEIGAILSIIVADWPDFGLIIALLMFNSSIAYWEESQAGNAIAALKAQLTPKANVKRDGSWTVIDAANLVPGDIIRIKLGDVAPADLKILNGENVKADQSALTGESLPVSKEVGDEIFSGSALKMGECECLVHSTGTNTFFGRTASLVANTATSGHFQSILRTIGWFCIIFIFVFVVAEVLVQFVGRGASCQIVGYEDRCPNLSNVVVLIVGGIPVAMPTVLSVTMAIGASQLAKKKAIVRRLTAVEELAGMNILCSDKTGTLTLNQLTIDEPYPCPGFTPEQVIFDAGLASKHGDAIDDAIDIAIIDTIRDEGREEELLTYTIDRFKPFDPIGKRTEAFVRSPDGKQFKAAKGAPQIILGIASNKSKISADIERQINDFASRGLRCIGVARSETAHDQPEQWVMVGLLPLFDPPREDTQETIETALKMGVKVKMITGDQLAIAKETARRLGMSSKTIHTAAEFAAAERAELERERKERIRTHKVDSGDKMNASSPFTQMIEDADGFAQVFPETKYEIVKRLQDAGNFVGMTGDGVNDAPALKKANVGIAVAGATDAARAAADIVLMSPGLHVIIDAFIGSRKTFQRMKNYATYSISVTVRVVLSFAVLTIAFDFLFPTIIVVILAILNDGTILTISKDRVHPSPEPDKWKLNEVFTIAFALGTWLAIGTIVLFVLARETNIFQDWFHLHNLTDPELRGLLYIFISASGQATIFVTRTRGFSYKDKPANLLLGAFILAQTIATIIGVYGFRGYPRGNGGVQSFQGCGWQWAVLAWVWTAIFYVPMDFIKMGINKYIFGREVKHASIPNRFRNHERALQETSREGKAVKSRVSDGKKGGAAPTPLGDLQAPHAVSKSGINV